MWIVPCDNCPPNFGIWVSPLSPGPWNWAGSTVRAAVNSVRPLQGGPVVVLLHSHCIAEIISLIMSFWLSKETTVYNTVYGKDLRRVLPNQAGRPSTCPAFCLSQWPPRKPNNQGTKVAVSPTVVLELHKGGSSGEHGGGASTHQTWSLPPPLAGLLSLLEKALCTHL